ncbi:DUF3348 domain-containing protein [Stenotrophomonas sp. LGBM10]|uniref:DUF3348 domain-containing protein n=1 Tax=Stenotrophomonas sp. LGBM10 TaxID=3390038 RepID=UPI00398ACFB6
MANTPHRTPVAGPAFIRLLSGLMDGGIALSSPDLSDRLSQWVDWTRAVALSRALDGRLPPAPETGPAFNATEDADCARARATLAASLQQDAELERAVADGADFAAFGQRYQAQQRAMMAATGRLRGRLRDMLAAVSPAMARLAEIDAVMEQTLSPRENALLAGIPTLLGAHFQRLQDAAQPPADATPASTPPHVPAWRTAFRIDMQNVAMAELDVRFQPIEGLLAALRPR